MLIAVGNRWDRLASWAAVTTSEDGLVWSDDTVNPFNARVSLTGVAASDFTTIVVGSGGAVANSQDLISWNTGKIWQGNFQPLSICCNNSEFFVAGQGKIIQATGPYQDLAEAAQVFRNTSGHVDEWELIYSYAASQSSRFYGIKHIDAAGVIIALGSADARPLGIYSLDSGVNWESIKFPNLPNLKYAYDVVYDNGVFWFSMNGMILTTNNLITPGWDASAVIKPEYGHADLRKMAIDPISKKVVAACSGGLVYSTDQNTWAIFQVPGYRFTSITHYNGLWIAGADSNLSMHTYWTSQNALSWLPNNNQVHMYDFAQI